jgi:hypothetical protein
MRKLLLAVLLVCVYGMAYAHALYQSKSFTFHRDGDIVDVMLDQNNTLHVHVNTIAVGTRTNFCRRTDN